MKIYLSLLISKKNLSTLKKCLVSLNNLKIHNGINFKFVFIIDHRIKIVSNLIGNIIDKKKCVFIFSKKTNIPYSRNRFLNYLKLNKFDYAGFIDDDCLIDKNWLINMYKFIKQEKCHVVGGPQYHEIKNKKFKTYYDNLEPKKKNKETTKWIATNNCFFSNYIFKVRNFEFEEKLRNYGGSDQLFFLQLTLNGIIIKWNNSAFVIEQYQSNREKINWFFIRNLRYGYSGNQIDKIIYQKKGYLIIFIKIIFLIFNIGFNLFFLKRKNLILSQFYFFRVIGRIKDLLNYKPKKYV
jgi:hypothetical protein